MGEHNENSLELTLERGIERQAKLNQFRKFTLTWIVWRRTRWTKIGGNMMLRILRPMIN